jgi:magnesium chelatase family protein
MPLAQVQGVVVSGVTGAMVQVEVEVSQGLPSVGVVGLPDTSVTESRWRARSAIASIGATWPNRRVTIGLSPAEVRKNGAGLDLPIALGVLAASNQLAGVDLAATTFIGELGLDGTLRPTRGALAGALAARRAGIERVIAPPQSAREMTRLPGLRVVVAGNLAQVIAVLRGGDPGEVASVGGGTRSLPECDEPGAPDLRDVRGQAQARFAIEVAAAGAHNIALVGVPGVGKTLLAERLPGLLPDLDDEAAIEVAAIHSVAGLARPGMLFSRPPFRSPHHSSSGAALLGSVQGQRVTPGAVTLAHHGVLFMDEAPEFSRPCLEGLRQPIESGVVSLGRSGWSGVLPAAFQLVLAANPCPCGMRAGTASDCSCSPVALRRYDSRLSGPLMDRIDIRLSMSRPPESALLRVDEQEPSALVRTRVEVARARASRRFAGLPWSVNARIPAGELRRTWAPDAGGADLLRTLERRSANLRGPDRVLRMAWTIADLQGRDRPGRDDVATAMSLRGATTTWAA